MPSIAMIPRAPTESSEWEYLQLEQLSKRVNIPINVTTPPALIEAIQQDPFPHAAKYGLIFVYMGIILLGIATMMRLYNYWGDKIRTALFKQDIVDAINSPSPESQYEGLESAMTDGSTRHFFPAHGPLVPEKPKQQASVSAIAPINNAIALFRWVFYRPVPVLRVGRWRVVLPSFSVIAIIAIALVASVLYCFLPAPLYYKSMAYGSPPLAVRAGMISISLMPWVVVLAMKANPITYLTGIGHERLIVLHRWGAYLCVLFAVIHCIPYWHQALNDPEGFQIFKLYFHQKYYIFTTGITALVPLLFLTLHSLPFLRTKCYEAFVMLHIPVSYVFIGLLFWHCNNYLRSWAYLYTTIVLVVFSFFCRMFYLNWTNPFRPSWLIGEESAVTILPENAVKVTIPTQKKWRPGQYVYLRMPGIAIFENHPFTIASLCSEDFPSEYGEQYRDMTLVFRPFSGFTRKVYNTAIQKGPYKTYRAFVDGPYGGMQRQMSSFDQVIFFAGGSGITAIASQLLDLIKRMRDGKATTTQVHVIWAMKRPELMEWFKEELRICRECAPPASVQCHFFITAVKRQETIFPPEYKKENRLSGIHEKINDTLQGVASKRNSALMMDADPISKRNSALMMDADPDSKAEYDDTISALPQAYLAPPRHSAPPFAPQYFPPPPSSPPQGMLPSTLSQAQTDASRNFDFGFPSTPTQFQKNLIRFAFLPTNNRGDGWRTEYGRPDIPYMLQGLSRDFGRRTCVYVCGPPAMRTDVASTVAKLQQQVWSDPGKDEIFLHAENYAI